MSSRRVLKAAQAIREVVSTAILIDLRDPRIKDVTVTFVEVSGDMRQARVNVSVMGDEQKQKLCLKGLQNSAGFLQRKVADRIDTRYTPKLQFKLDKGLQNAMAVTRILDEVLSFDEPDLGELQTDDDSATDSDSTDADSTDADAANSDSHSKSDIPVD